MNQKDLQEMYFHVRQAQNRAYETRSCIIIGCGNCDYAYICEVTNLLLKFIQHELNKYNAKGELKDGTK